MLKQYEAVFIMTPVLSEDQMKETAEKFEKLLKDNGAEIVHQENWGLRPLRYPIQKKTSGFYHLIEFKADPSFVHTFEVHLKREERIIRFLTVALDKHAIAYNERKREKKAQQGNTTNNEGKEA